MKVCTDKRISISDDVNSRDSDTISDNDNDNDEVGQ